MPRVMMMQMMVLINAGIYKALFRTHVAMIQTHASFHWATFKADDF